MKRKFFAAFLSLCMVMSLVPMTALAAEDTVTTSAPTASGNNFFANGTPITITAAKPEGGAEAELDMESTATGSSAYISWTEDGATKYVGVSGSTASIFGGSDGRESAVSVPSTSITMTGGTVKNILGGNLGQENADQNGCSSVTGDVNISITGGSVTNLIYGGGENNTCVNGTVAITLKNVVLGENCYVNGGVLGHGTEGDRNIEAGTMTTYAVVNKVIINATNSTACVLGGGGSGSTKVQEAIVTLNGCTVDYLYASGINGEMEKSSLKATGCKVTKELAATNRGFIKTADVTLEDCEISQLMTGATTGCFETDSGKPDGSGITGSIVWKIDEQTRVTTARLTPLAKRDTNDQTTATLDNITIEKSGDPLEISVDEFEPHSNASVNTFLVSETGTLTLNNVKTTIADGNTLTNAGTIEMDETSILTVDSGATLGQAGTVNGGTVAGAGAITKYVARVGNTGYESLEAALDAVKASGGTITLLQNATLDNANYTISKPVTIQGAGTIDATVADGASTIGFRINDDASLTLDGVTMNIKGTTADSSEEGNDGTAIELQNGGSLLVKNGASLNLTNLNRGMIMTGTPAPVKTAVSVEDATLTAKGIDGNFSNGGQFTFTNATVKIEDCGDHALSANKVTVDNSNLVINGAEKRGISINDSEGALTLKNNASVSVENCGTDYTADADKEKYAVVIGSDTNSGKVSLDATSTLSVTDCTNGNVIDLAGKSTMENNGVVNATVNLSGNSSQYIVTYKNEGKQVNVVTVAVTEGQATVKLPAALPDYGYNHFVGWSNGTTTYQPGETVTITADTTFTAVWSYTPPANPNYKITIGAMENGTVTANPTAAKAGATVTLTPVPDEGYALSTLTVTDRFGDAVRVTEQADGTYTFPMPNGQVTVTATFVQVEEPAPTEPFVDVNEGDWFYDAVVYAYQNELMDGVGGNRFAPNSETTRAQLVTILYRLEGEPAVSGDLPFTDVEAGIWYTDAILWAAQNNIVNGVNDTEFAPGDDLTRQQLVTILYRYAETKGYDVSASADLSGYPDADQVQDYAQPAMAWAVAENIIQGMEDGTLKPAGNASRAQIATILMRFCEDVAQ